MRYYFHLADDRREPDHVGMDLADDYSAKTEAVRYAGELLQAEPNSLWQQGQRRVEVTDEHGTLRWMVITLAIDAPGADEHVDPSEVVSA